MMMFEVPGMKKDTAGLVCEGTVTVGFIPFDDAGNVGGHLGMEWLWNLYLQCGGFGK